MKLPILFCLILLLNSCGKENIDHRINFIDTFLEGQATHYQFNGNVLIAEKGQVIYQKSFGLSQYDLNEFLNDTTVFELASVSKQFTAMGILILCEQGKISLSDSLRSFFPELPYHNITVHHLLSHTSGLPDYMKLMREKWDHSVIAFNDDMIKLLVDEKPDIHFKPGEKWEYSNTGYVLLASIIEKISGESFKDFMARNIFQPLQMNHSRIYNTRRSAKEVIPNYAYGFVFSDSLKNYALPDSLPGFEFVYWMDGIQGDGITNATTGDLLKWDRALVNNSLISKELMKEMFSPQAVTDRHLDASYGYGVELGKDKFGNKIYHGGSWPGYSTMMLRYIEDDKTIIILSNNQSSAAAISTSLAHILNEHVIIEPYAHIPIKSESETSENFAGTYSVYNVQYNIGHEGDSLFITFPSGNRFKLQAESKNKIYMDDPWTYDLQFEWEKDDLGNDRFYRILYGLREEITKLDPTTK